MIGWIKYLWGCDWSKENDIFDNCQVLSQHESEILDGRDQRLSFSPGSALRSAFRVANFQMKKIILKESLWDQGMTTVNPERKQFFSGGGYGYTMESLNNFLVTKSYFMGFDGNWRMG